MRVIKRTVRTLHKDSRLRTSKSLVRLSPHTRDEVDSEQIYIPDIPSNSVFEIECFFPIPDSFVEQRQLENLICKVTVGDALRLLPYHIYQYWNPEANLTSFISILSQFLFSSFFIGIKIERSLRYCVQSIIFTMTDSSTRTANIPVPYRYGSSYLDLAKLPSV